MVDSAKQLRFGIPFSRDKSCHQISAKQGIGVSVWQSRLFFEVIGIAQTVIVTFTTTLRLARLSKV